MPDSQPFDLTKIQEICKEFSKSQKTEALAPGARFREIALVHCFSPGAYWHSPRPPCPMIHRLPFPLPHEICQNRPSLARISCIFWQTCSFTKLYYTLQAYIVYACAVVHITIYTNTYY
jgi:hypothetical protein